MSDLYLGYDGSVDVPVCIDCKRPLKKIFKSTVVCFCATDPVKRKAELDAESIERRTDYLRWRLRDYGIDSSGLTLAQMETQDALISAVESADYFTETDPD
jgi:hypothetical protein